MTPLTLIGTSVFPKTFRFICSSCHFLKQLFFSEVQLLFHYTHVPYDQSKWRTYLLNISGIRNNMTNAGPPIYGKALSSLSKRQSCLLLQFCSFLIHYLIRGIVWDLKIMSTWLMQEIHLIVIFCEYYDSQEEREIHLYALRSLKIKLYFKNKFYCHKVFLLCHSSPQWECDGPFIMSSIWIMLEDVKIKWRFQKRRASYNFAKKKKRGGQITSQIISQ